MHLTSHTIGLLQNIASRAHEQSRGSKAIAVRMAARV